MNHKDFISRNKQLPYASNTKLINDLENEKQKSIFNMGMIALKAEKFGCAISFFKIAKREGYDEADEFINLIRKLVKMKSNT